MGTPDLHVVTGALGYSGQYIARLLLDRGHRVRTLTASPQRPNPFGQRLEIHPLAFDRPDQLAESLRGADVLYNTYWVRFNHRQFTFAQAVRNTQALFAAAARAGVRRVVHVSITNPSESSPLEYFAGKARLERDLAQSGLSHAVLRPAVLFGGADILVNNIAWALRRFALFGLFGDGQYRIQPIHVEDFAALAVEAGGGTQNAVINAVGPECFTYRELVERVGAIIGCRRRIVGLPPGLAYAVTTLAGWLVGDVIVTREEVAGLMADLLHVDTPPTGSTRLTEWAAAHRDTLGRKYASELARRRDRAVAYDAAR